ncbi:MAG TPA: DUF1707 domain-containing protein [Streptosporangiaceae bacterium]
MVPLAFVGPGPWFHPSEQLASDADRDIAVDMLCAAVADGRLTLAELDERVGAALSARTLTELAALIVDLSTPASLNTLASLSAPVSQQAAARRPASERVNTAERWALLQSLAIARDLGPYRQASHAGETKHV